MTEPQTPPDAIAPFAADPIDTSPEQAESEKAAREKAAKQRFFALSLFRLSGIAILIAAWFIILGKAGFVTGQKAKTLGAIIAAIGLVQTIIVPRLLAGIWRTPRP
ncbi:MAG: hypothetical protein AB7E05_10335 [Sphingobium sp.]